MEEWGKREKSVCERGREGERGRRREGEKERLRSACVCGLYFSAGHWGDCVRESECDYYSLRVEVCVCVSV